MTAFHERLQSLHARIPERVAVYLQYSGQPGLPISYRQLMRGSTVYADFWAWLDAKY